MAVEEENPCLDLLCFSIKKHYPKVVPKDNALKHEPEVEMLDVKEVKSILDLYQKEAPTNTESGYTFALVSVAYMFGLRPGEILALKKANVDFDNKILQIKGSIVDGKFFKYLKYRDSYSFGGWTSLPTKEFCKEWTDTLVSITSHFHDKSEFPIMQDIELKEIKEEVEPRFLSGVTELNGEDS